MQLLATLAAAAALALLASASALAAPQGFVGDYDLDKLNQGLLGATLDLEFDGARPNKVLLAMYSFNGGPTPLAALQAQDPRVLAVGTDETAGWFTQLTGPSGQGIVSISVPNSTVFQGNRVHFQTLTIPGTSLLVDQVSNKVLVQLGAASTATAMPITLGTARAVAIPCWDRDNDSGAGDLVLAGGGSGTLFSSLGLNSSERYGFRGMVRSAGPQLNSARALTSAVELPDGRTLLVGGVDSTGAVLASCELYDPAQNAFVSTGSLGTGRVGHGITVLPNGRVLIAGGTSSLTDATAAFSNALSSAEEWNPATGIWSSTSPIGGRRLGPALSTLSNGQVMASGGVQISFFFGFPVSAVSTTACQFYNQATRVWSNAPSMQQGRAYHQSNQVTLNDGRLLLTGGAFVPSLLAAQQSTGLSEAEYFDPATGTWTSANMVQVRALHTTSVLPDGRVVVAGGAQGTLLAPVAVPSTEVFNPNTNVWSVGPALTSPRAGHAALVTPDGLLVMLGGQDSSGASVATTECLHF